MATDTSRPLWLLLVGRSLELWAGKAEAAEVETAPTWVQLLSPHASSPGGHPSPKVLPLALRRESAAFRKAANDLQIPPHPSGAAWHTTPSLPCFSESLK